MPGYNYVFNLDSQQERGGALQISGVHRGLALNEQGSHGLRLWIGLYMGIHGISICTR